MKFKSEKYALWLGNQEFETKLDEFEAALNWYEKNIGQTEFYEFTSLLIDVVRAARIVSETYRITCPPDSIFVCFEKLADTLAALEQTPTPPAAGGGEG